MKEIWAQFRDTPYDVSNFGNVRRGNRLIRPNRTTGGYLTVSISVNGAVTKFRVHRMVVETFLGAVELPLQVNHKDGNPANNHLINLEICTPKENSLHAREILKRQTGAQRKQAILTDDIVLEMRERYVTEKNLTQRQLAEEYNISLTTVNMALHGKKIWKHI